MKVLIQKKKDWEKIWHQQVWYLNPMSIWKSPVIFNFHHEKSFSILRGLGKIMGPKQLVWITCLLHIHHFSYIQFYLQCKVEQSITWNCDNIQHKIHIISGTIFLCGSIKSKHKWHISTEWFKNNLLLQI